MFVKMSFFFLLLIRTNWCTICKIIYFIAVGLIVQVPINEYEQNISLRFLLKNLALPFIMYPAGIYCWKISAIFIDHSMQISACCGCGIVGNSQIARSESE